MTDTSADGIDDALSQLCDGRLSEPQRLALMSALRGSKAARDAYIRHVSLHFWLRSILHREDADGEQVVTAGPARVPAAPRGVRLPWWSAAASAAAILAAMWLVGLPGGAGRRCLPPPITAVVVGAVDCRWSGTERRAVGDVIRGGEFVSTESGTLALLFDSRTRVVAKGPVSFQVKSAAQCDLQRGELMVRVLPGGKGFRVTAGTLHVIDRGTTFGVRRDRENRVEVEVFEGEVALCDAEATPAAGVEDAAPLLRKGQTAAVTLGSQATAQIIRLGASLSAAFTTAAGVEDVPDGSQAAGVVFDGFSQSGPDGRIDKAGGGVGWTSPWSDSHDRSVTAAWVVAEGTAMNDRPGVGGAVRDVRLKMDPSEPIYAAATLQLASDDPASPSLVWLTLFQEARKKVVPGTSTLRAGFGISASEYFCGFGSTEAPVGKFLNDRPRGGFAAYKTGQATRMIVKIEADAVGPADRLSVWIDPAPGAREADVAPASVVTGSLEGGAVEKIALRFSCKGDTTKAVVDDLRLGRSWSSVAD